MRPSYVATGAAGRRGRGIASFTPLCRRDGRGGSAGILRPFGAWRSLVAHPAGGRAVGGSNPLAPTTSRRYGYAESRRVWDSAWDSPAGLCQGVADMEGTLKNRVDCPVAAVLPVWRSARTPGRPALTRRLITGKVAVRLPERSNLSIARRPIFA